MGIGFVAVTGAPPPRPDHQRVRLALISCILFLGKNVLNGKSYVYIIFRSILPLVPPPIEVVREHHSVVVQVCGGFVLVSLLLLFIISILFLCLNFNFDG